MTAYANADQIHLAQAMKYEMKNYTAQLFEPCSGQVFVFQKPSAGGVSPDLIRLQLAEVMKSKSGTLPAGFREPFSLLFTLSEGTPFPGGLYRLVHEDFESCDWFLSRVAVPRGDSRVAYYEAVFG